jgi:hypothetical protein
MTQSSFDFAQDEATLCPDPKTVLTLSEVEGRGREACLCRVREHFLCFSFRFVD